MSQHDVKNYESYCGQVKARLSLPLIGYQKNFLWVAQWLGLGIGW